jgi:hypothetical protein
MEENIGKDMKNILNKTKILLLIYSCFYTSYAKSNNCSYNGTEVIFINGVFNTKAPRFAAEIIKKKINEIRNEIDVGYDDNSAGNVNVDYVHNRSAGLVGELDLIEAMLQLANLTTSSDKYQAISQTLFNVNLVMPDQSQVEVDSELNEKILKKRAEFIKNSIGNLTEQDTLLLTDKIKSALEDHKKVILISHSQGNLFASESNRVLREYYSDALSILNYTGNLRIASPYADENMPNSDNILVDQDQVINNPFLITAANPTHRLKEVNRVPAYFTTDGKMVGGTNYGSGHGIEEIYLSETIKVKGVDENGPYEKTMAEVFIDQLKAVAKSIPSNCGSIKIDVEEESQGEGKTPKFKLGSSKLYIDPYSENERFNAPVFEYEWSWNYVSGWKNFATEILSKNTLTEEVVIPTYSYSGIHDISLKIKDPKTGREQYWTSNEFLIKGTGPTGGCSASCINSNETIGAEVTCHVTDGDSKVAYITSSVGAKATYYPLLGTGRWTSIQNSPRGGEATYSVSDPEGNGYTGTFIMPKCVP